MRAGALLALAVATGALAAGCGLFGGTPADPLAPRRGDPGRPVLGFRWKKSLHERSGEHRPQEFARPTIRGATLYVGSHEGTLYALSADDGQVVWRTELGAMSSQPLVDRGRIYVGTDDGILFALSVYDGSIAWRHRTKGAILHAPVVVGDVLVFSNDVDHVYALDRDSGRWRWQYERETPEEFTMRGHAGIVADGDRVYAGFADGNLVALNAGTGEALWVRSLAGTETQYVDVDTTPTIQGETIYVASTAGGLYALDKNDGTERWRFDVRGAGPVAVDDEYVYFGAADEGLYALDRRGHVVWRQGMRRAGDPARPIVTGDLLLATASEIGLLAIDRRTGELVRWFDPGPGISAEPLLAEGRLYFLSNGGSLYAFDLAAR